MKIYLFLFLSTVFLFSCSQSNEQKIVVSSQNDLLFKEIIVEKADMQVMNDQYPVIIDNNGKEVPSQLEDSDGDSVWDILVFQASLSANTSKEYTIKWHDSAPSYDKKTQVYLGYSENRDDTFVSIDEHQRPKDHVAMSTPYLYQYEGPGWESNLVGFRTYFDSRNGKDIWGKTTEELVLHKIGLGEDYHAMQDWGMDILKVGNSLGSGALAIKKSDSLIRLGDTEYAYFKKRAEGPVRSVFTLTYKGWDVLGTSYEIEEKVTIYANKRWFSSEVTLSRPQDTVVTGIVNLKDAKVAFSNEPDGKLLYSYGEQSENSDFLGMALIIPSANFIMVDKAPVEGGGIVNTELVYLKPSEDTYSYYFYVGWEKESDKFSSESGFGEELKNAASQIFADVKVTIE